MVEAGKKVYWFIGDTRTEPCGHPTDEWEGKVGKMAGRQCGNEHIREWYVDSHTVDNYFPQREEKKK